MVSKIIPLLVKGVMLSNTMETEEVSEPIQYHFLKLSVRSATGPHKNLQRLAETPNATMLAVCATEKPF